MLFNSLDFAFFLPIVFALYWFVFNKNLRLQNGLIVVASYYFYGMWDWKFLSLILFSTIVDFSIGLALKQQKTPKKRKLLLWCSILTNLGILGFFKYFNFFIENFSIAFSLLGYQIPTTSLDIILPVGISFYTFQTLSYTIDVYKNKLEPTKDFIAFSAFVSFFPQLVAGPIERATHLLPQFYRFRTFDYAKSVDGLRQILWGLFKKVVIADNCAELANIAFDQSDSMNGSGMIIGAIFFTFQIYGDFSGYSDIAIGTSRLFGFDLMQNFAFPYFSRDISEFWRRWHISLSTWFRDYLYIPLGGSKGGTSLKVRNTFIIFIVSGFWHGANWTFLAWGALNAVYFLPLLLSNKNRVHMNIVANDQLLPTLKETFAIAKTFALTVVAWIFFRAESLTHVKEIFGTICSSSILQFPDFTTSRTLLNTFFLIGLLILVEWIGRRNKHALENWNTILNKPLRFASYLIIALFILWLGGKEQEFIYFQF
jgi:alginate O-acetyltransferase complex protein AlgI